MGHLVVALVAVAVAIFAMQNTASVTVRFVVWQVGEVPLAAVVLLSLGAGLIIAGIPLWFQLWRARSRLRGVDSSPPPPPTPGDRYE
jgi:uncharacterized integral membrane protein